MKKINADFKYLFITYVLLIIAIIATWAHHGNVIIDFGREAYYPTQILAGKILYKDIFNIYGPFAYMLNAFMFKLLGVKLNLLYLSGSICAFIITSFTYLISKEFLPKLLSFSIAIFTIATGILNLNLFNFIAPYSYAMLYGTTSFLVSFWFLLRYQKEPEKNLYFYLSCFFAGICIASKYEFLPYLIIILYTAIKTKPLKAKEYYYAIFSLVFMPVFCFGILFLQGLHITDLINTAVIIKKMAHSETLRYFYVTQGIYFHKKTVGILLLNLIKTIIPLSLIAYGFHSSRQYIKLLLIILSIFLMIFWITPASLTFLPIIAVVLTLFHFKPVLKNTMLIILVFSCILMNLKDFWGFIIINYGVFFAGFLLITIFTIILDILKNKEIFTKVLICWTLIFSVILGVRNLANIFTKTYLLKTERGSIYTDISTGKATTELIKYIDQNTKKTDKIVILPEGTLINFLTDRKSDNFYLSLIPLYVESFGEENIIQHFRENKPEYIVFNNWNTKDYYFSYICQDYAIGFCSFVGENYKQVKVIDTGFRYLIMKRQ